ncbi:MAG TPA: ribonuclease P protein component [Gemmatimonadales bacterium]|nr:ribonuclease P protein component [Gemmatimonadales bacterium]
MTGNEGLPRARRLSASAEIRRTLERGKRKRLSHLDVIWTENSAGHPRMGLIVPKFQSTAVARNRLRRRLREVWRRELQATMPAVDLIIRARREAYRASFDALRGELTGWRDEVTG